MIESVFLVKTVNIAMPAPIIRKAVETRQRLEELL